MALIHIKKRDNRVVAFEKEKILHAVEKAFHATKTGGHQDAEKITHYVLHVLEKKFRYTTPTVENVQDTVEEALIKNGYARVGSAYVLYREKHRKQREERGVREWHEEPRLSVNAMKVLQRRYLLRDTEGNIVETPQQLFRRVARAIAAADKEYKQNAHHAEEEFYEMMINLEFLPNTPTLMNAGAQPSLGLAACYVLPIEDNLESIFSSLKWQALIHQGGGGVGFSFNRLRPKGELIQSSKGTSSGPVSFMRIFDTATDVIKNGGKRRGANMAVLRVDHPDILAFVSCKQQKGFLENFNISVAITDVFMHALKMNRTYALINPHTQKEVRKTAARDVWKKIMENAWKTGDPGIIFIDEINRHNAVLEAGEIETTNPCGEQPLLPFESCTLGSINLTKFVKQKEVQWDKLGNIVERAVHFLDNTLDASTIPLMDVERTTKENRRIGLGVMGWAEMLILLEIRYDSNEALRMAETVMKFIQDHAHEASKQLAVIRGNFPNFNKSTWKKTQDYMRNVAVTTIAPTGSLSIIANTSSGIEPLFGISFVREVMEGTQLPETNPVFTKIAKERGFYTEALMKKIAQNGSAAKVNMPHDIKRLFVTAHEIKPEWHVRMQAAFQKFTDNAVSKTVNLPPDAAVKDVEKAYMLAYELQCKGITVFRYGSKEQQVLYLGKKVEAEFAGGCPGKQCGN